MGYLARARLFTHSVLLVADRRLGARHRDGSGGAMVPQRPYFTVAAVALLGAAFCYAYRRRNAEFTPGEGHAIGENRRRRRIVLWLVAIVTVALLTVGEWSSWVIYWML